MSLLVREGLVEGSAVDLRVRDGVVVEMAQGLRRDGEEVLGAAGGAVIPGLHDHHLHLHALAADFSSVRCGPPSVRSADDLASALRTGGPVRGTGYHESVAGPLDRDVLDALVGHVPVRVQHRSGAAWFLNTAALSATGLLDSADPAVERDADGRATGRVLRGDHLLRRSSDALPDLEPVGRLLASYGVTGVTDATPRLTLPALQALRGALPQRLLLLGAPLDDGGADVGPWKVLLDEAAGLDLDALVAQVSACRAVGRSVAFHAVTVAEAVVALAALRAAGPLPGDRLEHGSLLPPDLDADLRSLGVTVVTQPHFVSERGDDYLDDVDPRDAALLYRCASLLDGGVAVAGGTDAPYGRADPWALVVAAMARRTENGVVLGPQERLDPLRALGLVLGALRDPGGPARKIEVGVAADLCLLDAPLDVVLREPSADHVAATVIAGRVVHVTR
jgi:predicted amidohydrolase YtcJ